MTSQNQSESVHPLASDRVTDDRVYQYLCTQKAVQNWIQKVLDVKLADDLHQALKNGIVLCYLMREIDERSIPMIQENTSHFFKLKENILYFLDAVVYYGVAKYKMFQVTDLWDNANLVKVVECLAALAQTAAENKFKVPIEQVADTKETRTELSAEKMKQLKTLLSKVKYTDDTGKGRPKQSAALVRRKMQFLLAAEGNKLKFEELEKRFTKFQARVRGALTRNSYRKRVRDAYYRGKIAKEILDTEIAYVDNLKICIENYYKPLKAAAESKKTSILTVEQLRKLFSDIEIIHGLNSQFKESVQQRVEKWSNTQCISDVFLNIVGSFKVYTNYVQNFDQSLGVLETLKKNTKWAAFEEEAKSKEEVKQMAIDSYLIMPIQRIPRYSLLVSDLVRHTWTDHQDYENLTKARDRMEEVASYLNSKKRDFENIQKLLTVQTSITGCDITIAEPHRVLILQKDFKDHQTLILFNDLLLLGKSEKKGKGKSAIKYKCSWPLGSITVNEPPESKKQGPSIQVLKAGVVVAKATALTPQDKKEFVDTFQKAYDTLTQRKKEKEEKEKEKKGRRGISNYEPRTKAPN